MTDFLSSGGMLPSENVSIDWGPVSMASSMCSGSTPRIFGAKPPRGMAPPEPSKLWHAVQLARKIWPPRVSVLVGTPRSDSVARGVVMSPSGIDGPVPRLATYAASAAISSSVVDDLALRGAWSPGVRHRHPAGADLEVDRSGADVGQRRAVLVAVLGRRAFAVLAVAERAADDEELTALLDEVLLALGRVGLGRRERGVEPAGQQQPEQQHARPAIGPRRCRERRPAERFRRRTFSPCRSGTTRSGHWSAYLTR